MADRSISQLNGLAAPELEALINNAAEGLFVLQFEGTARQFTGNNFATWLTSLAGGKGGIDSITLQGTVGLVDTYQINYVNSLANKEPTTFTVTNGKSVTDITVYYALTNKPSPVPNKSAFSTKVPTLTSTNRYLWSYTKLTFDDIDNPTWESPIAIIGVWGDKGDQTYVHIRWKADDEESELLTTPSNYIGIATSTNSVAPTDPDKYAWYLYKGETGDPATIDTESVKYGISDSLTNEPSIWHDTIPSEVDPGKYLWARTTIQFNSGNPIIRDSVSYMGRNGDGSVNKVAGRFPDGTGNIQLTAADIDAIPNTANSVTANNLAPEAISKVFTATITNDGWSGSGDWFSKTMTITGLTEGSNYTVDVQGSTSGGESRQDIIDAWSVIDSITISDNSLTAYATEVPEVSIPIKILRITK